MSDDIPKLVRDDPWLEPYSDHITWRMIRLEDHLREIDAKAGSLRDYASMHLDHGIHYDFSDDTWKVREWAPGAKHVSLTGSFNDWNRDAYPLTKNDDGTWVASLPGDAINHGDLVKLHIVGADNSVRDRIPATIHRAVQDETTKDYAGQIWQSDEPYAWKHEFDPSCIKSPLIYEAHVGMSGEEPRLHTYREFATDVLPRIAELGYNSIQLMAIQEHPYYGSFGYHVSSFFAACSRFGTPEDLKHLIDTAHGMGIAVIIDIVHSHAVKNFAEGLNEFDGTDHQYFHSGSKGDHPQWDSKCFDYGKEEVRRFLLSNVRYWLEEFHFDGSDIEPMLTYGTNPGMGIKINGLIPQDNSPSFKKSLEYMDFEAGSSLLDTPINYVFIGSCTNSRIEDFRVAAKYVKGKKKAENVTAWLVPGSKQVEAQIIEEGLKDIFNDAGFELRQPGCSACLAMNEDKIPQGEYCVSTSNRNFEGRQGQGARTILASPLVAAATAIEGKLIDITKHLN